MRYTFLYISSRPLHDHDVKLKFQVSPENMNKRELFPTFFPQLKYSPLQFNSRKIHQSHEFWNSTNSLFKRRFRPRHRRGHCSKLSNFMIFLKRCVKEDFPFFLGDRSEISRYCHATLANSGRLTRCSQNHMILILTFDFKKKQWSKRFLTQTSSKGTAYS